MVAVGLWYRQAYVMDNEHRSILLMAFWLHRDMVTRSWGPLLCHSSTTITSCCSMIMHSPMMWGSVHNSWKLNILNSCMASILTGHVTHWACLGCSGSVYKKKRVPVPANIQLLRTAIEEEWTNISQATINNLINSMRRRCVALHEANGGHTRYWLVFGHHHFSFILALYTKSRPC